VKARSVTALTGSTYMSAGTITSLWIAPESGTWLLEEVALLSGGDAPAVRFHCGRLLGDREPAAALTPSVVVERTPEERRQRTEEGLAEYVSGGCVLGAIREWGLCPRSQA
jgi:hypothetical protein